MTKKTKTPYERTMNSLFGGNNTEISGKGADLIRGFLGDNYPSTKLIKLNTGAYYLEENMKDRQAINDWHAEEASVGLL